MTALEQMVKILETRDPQHLTWTKKEYPEFDETEITIRKENKEVLTFSFNTSFGDIITFNY